jgi:hypothetical protein
VIFRSFPEARFVHVLRDGRDVACSLRTHPRHKVVDGKLVPLDTWKPIAGGARRWVRDIESSRRWWKDPRFHTVRYEDLVLNPRPELERLMAFLGEDWDDAMLAHTAADSPFRDATRFAQNPEALGAVSTASLSRWQRELERARQAHLQTHRGAAARRAGLCEQSGLVTVLSRHSAIHRGARSREAPALPLNSARFGSLRRRRRACLKNSRRTSRD